MTKKRLSRRERDRQTQLQVQEYVNRYYPEMGEITVEVSRCGNFVRVFPAQPSQEPKKT
jgi:hypothetical protein